MKLLKQKTNKEYGKNGSLFCMAMKSMEDGIAPYWSFSKSLVKEGDTITANRYFTDIISSGNTAFYATNNDKIYKYSSNEWSIIGNVAGYTIGFDRSVTTNLIFPNGNYVGIGTGLSSSPSFNFSWKALTSLTTEEQPVENYESFTFIGNGYQIAGFSGGGDDFASNMFELPASFKIKRIKSGKNGVLIGVNEGSHSYLVLWDGYSEVAITPWIPLHHQIVDICKYDGYWIVMTIDGYFHQTDGYSVKELTHFDGIDGQIGFYGGITATRDKLFVSAGHGISTTYGGTDPRRLAGVHIYDLKTGLWSFCPFNNFGNAHAGAVCIDYLNGSGTIWIATSYADDSDSGAVYPMRLTEGSYGGVSRSFYISKPFQNDKVAVIKGVFVKSGFISGYGFDTQSSIPLTLTAKVAGVDRPLFMRGFTNSASADKTLVVVDGTQTGCNTAEVGDEIMFLADKNYGETRHIASIADKDTNKERWTVDSAFTNTIATSMPIMITPFKTLGTRTVYSGKLEELYFECQQKIKSRDFYVKVDIQDSSGYISRLKIDEIGVLIKDLRFET